MCLYIYLYLKLARINIDNGYINPMIITAYLYMVLIKNVKLEILSGRIQIIVIKKIDI